MGRFADFRTGTRQRRIGIHHFHRRVDGRALFAVVAVLVGSTAAGAGALDETVGEEHALDRVVVLLDFLRVDEARLLEAAVYLLAQFVVFRRIRAVPVVEADMEAVEILLSSRGDFCDESLRGDAALLGGDHDRRAVDVVGTHKMHFVAGHSLMAHPDIRLDVFHDVAHVEGAVGVRQCRSNKKISLTHRRCCPRLKKKGFGMESEAINYCTRDPPPEGRNYLASR